ncbi:MAG: type II toxin-antitoxin system Phd/YefM family antitoxin [Fibrobacteraceae bacterium]|nr:type II toxin-antitoxin system Phd/YefM family antitoxin [Fibrobacteraceae bacterium]MBQ5611770.1 type II toxin-antitoxin system Phd/YefM family antitoxin [Fibrobacteraceae bacterium]
MEVRRNFGEILDQVRLTGEEFVIERAGKSLARLVPVSQETSGKLDFRDILKLPGV